jgi:hypothetical protein
MPRVISLLVATTLLALAVAAPAAAAKGSSCTKGDVQGIAQGTIAVAKQIFKERENGSGSAWLCQFRFYDDNDGDTPDSPEVPHVFRQGDWFLGGIFDWMTRAEMQEFAVDRAGAAALMGSIQDRLFWREQGGEWVELSLSETPYRSVRAPWGEILNVFRHRYHVFPGGTYEPGIYEWRVDSVVPFMDPPAYSTYGEVHIVAN